MTLSRRRAFGFAGALALPDIAIEMKENWGQIIGRFPGRGICENSNSSWFNDPVASLAAYAPILERVDPAYNAVHQTATFTAKRRDYKWRPAQSFVVDFRASNWG